MNPLTLLIAAVAAGLAFSAKRPRVSRVITEAQVEEVKVQSALILRDATQGEKFWTNPVDAIAFWVNATTGLPIVDSKLIRAHIQQESSFRPHVFRFEKNKDGKPWSVSLGLTQVLFPLTTDELAGPAGFQKDDIAGIFSPIKNLKSGIIFMARIKKRWTDPADRVAAYNAGSPRGEDGKPKASRNTPYFNEDYVKKVMKNYRDRGGTLPSEETRFN